MVLMLCILVPCCALPRALRALQSAPFSSVLVNDLDLVVWQDSKAKHYGNGRKASSPDGTNNVERVSRARNGRAVWGPGRT